MITGRRVVLTGTGGVLGRELGRQLRALRPESLALLDVDVRDPQAVDGFFGAARPDVVVHVAAFTFRRLAERRPSEAVKTNVQGTDHVVRAAAKYEAGRVVLVSSDQAGDPSSSMLGASMRVAELVVAHAAAQAAERPAGAAPVFAAVRVGEVVDGGPEGPLPEVLAAQLTAGGPVTLSGPDAVRSLVTAEQAAARVLDTVALAESGIVYEVDMGEPVRVVDLVRRIARERGLPEARIRFTHPGRGYPSGGVTRPEQRGETGISHVFSIQARRNPAELAELPERLHKLYAAAKKNRDPKVRQLLSGLSRG